MSSDEENVEQRKRKKGVVNADMYKRNAIKKRKLPEQSTSIGQGGFRLSNRVPLLAGK